MNRDLPHCSTCTCGCTCGFGGNHDPDNARCELNVRGATADTRPDRVRIFEDNAALLVTADTDPAGDNTTERTEI